MIGVPPLLGRNKSAVVACAVALAVTACASGSGSASRPTSTSPSADPLASMSTYDIANTAAQNLWSSSTVRIIWKSQDATATANAMQGGKCTGSVQSAGQGAEQFTLSGSTLWIKADDQYWKAHGASALAVEMIRGKYIELAEQQVKAAAKQGIAYITDLCETNIATEAMHFCPGDFPNFPGTKGGISVIDGQQALKLTATGDPDCGSTIYVTVAASPRLIRITKPGDGQVDFSDYGARVTVTPPPADETVNGALLGF